MSLVSLGRGRTPILTGRSVAFGFLTDTHHDPIKTTDGSPAKYYQDAVSKVTASVAAFNARPDLSLVFQNGDFIDGSADAATALTDLATIKSVFDGANAPRYHNIGNHELTNLTKTQVMAATGQPGKWYSFVPTGTDGVTKVTVLVLDGNFTADDDTSDLENTPTGSRSPFISYIPPTQRQWFGDTISSSPYPCVSICHYPMLYNGVFSWGLTNAAAVRSIIDSFNGKVISGICGHAHQNYILQSGKTLYITLDAVSTNPYPSVQHTIVTVYPDERVIKIEGHGTDTSITPVFG